MEKSLELAKFVNRPGVGHIGKKIRIRANFFEVLSLPPANIARYDVRIIPEVPPKLNRIVFARFVETYQAGYLGGVKPVFDGTFFGLPNNKKNKNSLLFNI